jgi:glycosyltransferase involved in cell wall biosynthesis
MILLVSANFPPEPVLAASLSKDLAESLADKMEVRVISPRPSRPLGFPFDTVNSSNGRYEHVILDSFYYAGSKMTGRFWESFSFGLHTARHIRKYHDSIGCCYVSAWPLFAQYLIIRKLKKYSIPAITHIQDIYPESLSNKIPLLGKIIKMMLIPLDKYILRNSLRVIANSEYMSREFLRSRGVAQDKIEIVRNWRSEDEFAGPEAVDHDRWRAQISGKSFVFMYLGNIGPVAGVDFLIRSFAEADIENAVLIIAGTGQDRQDCMMLAEAFSGSDIRFWDVPAGEVAAIQKVADVMLLPVRSGAALSSIPSKLIAYMFSGKPVIACVDESSDSAAEVLAAGCGWIAPPQNIDELAALMKMTASMNHDELSLRGENGLNYARKHYSVKNNLPKLVAVINEAVESRVLPAQA